MVTANDIHQILSSSGAIAQDIDGGFLLLTHQRPEEDTPKSDNLGPRPQAGSDPTAYQPSLFTPTFFDLSLKHLKYYSRCLKFKRETLINALEWADSSEFANAPRLRFSESEPLWHPASASDFEADFQEIQGLIHTGELTKAVLMTRETSAWRPQIKDKCRLLLALLRNCPQNLFIYGHWDEVAGVLGATPELLFDRHHDRVRTMALAGTLAKSKIEDSSFGGATLLQDPKELFEHQLVVEDLREKFSRLQSKWPETSIDLNFHGPSLLELPQLFHLQTQVNALHPQFAKQDGFDRELILTLHPTSALGLRSNTIPWTWLQKLRGHQQLGHFGAPVGLNLPHGYLCLVGIRNLEWDQEGSSIRAGCGIVGRSQAEREWEELQSKRNSVKALFKI